MKNHIKLVVGPEDSILQRVEVMREDDGVALVFNRKCEGMKEYAVTIPGGRVLIKKAAGKPLGEIKKTVEVEDMEELDG